MKRVRLATASKVALYVALLCMPLLMACETDSYDKGEGRYSLLQADFAELTINGEKQGVSFLTDEGEQYQIATPLSASWIETADTVYRAYLYYKKENSGKASVSALGSLPTMIPHDAKEYKRQPQDPVGVESIWLTRNGKYINMGLLLRNGRLDDGKEGIHSLGLICDTLMQNGDQTTTAYYRLLHEQGEAPEYYTNRRYVCILLPEKNRPDSVCLTIKTYDGNVVKKIKL